MVTEDENAYKRKRTHIFSRYPTPVGMRRYIPPSPRARHPYLAWLSIRIGGRVMPRMEEMVSVVECEECAASTDSRVVRSEGAGVGMCSGVEEVPLSGICELI
jgi:hypothetical protein